MEEKSHRAIFSLKLIPRASKNELTEIMENGTVKIRLTAPPVEGKANQALIDFLSVILELKKEDITIISGHASRSKLVSVEGFEKADLISRIDKVISSKKR